MDLRVKRTLISIKEAFYSLRKRKSVEKITVKELSEAAMINKATFYLHYKDIFDLSEKLQESFVDEIIAESLECGLTRTKESHLVFTERLLKAVWKRKDKIIILFSPNVNEFIYHLEKSLKPAIFTFIPEFRNNVEVDIALSYIIHGSYSASLGKYNCTHDQLVAYLSKFSLKLLQIT